MLQQKMMMKTWLMRCLSSGENLSPQKKATWQLTKNDGQWMKWKVPCFQASFEKVMEWEESIHLFGMGFHQPISKNAPKIPPNSTSQARRLTPSPEWHSPRAGRWSYPAWSWWRADRRWSRTTPGRIDPWGRWRWWSGLGSPHKPHAGRDIKGQSTRTVRGGDSNHQGDWIRKLCCIKLTVTFSWMQVFIQVFTIWDSWSFHISSMEMYSDKQW